VGEIVVVFVIGVRVMLVLLGFVVLLNVDKEALMLCDKLDFCWSSDRDCGSVRDRSGSSIGIVKLC